MKYFSAAVSPQPKAVTPPNPPAMCYSDSSLNQISLEYTYAELQEATRNFDASMKLGSGSYGGVYKGVLADSTEVATKVLDVPDEAGFEEEVKVLSKFRHPHLVILMGFARHGSQRLLVYEILSGGDVHKRLQRSCVEGVPFSWRERVSIALDAACGLSHLHHSSPKVFHRDIKTPNILLDRNGTAKMADFGLACLSHASAHRVKQASGTVGYACPLYVQRGVVTEGSEVYSFGIVLFELVTASPPAYMGKGTAGGPGKIQYLVNRINGDARTAIALADGNAHWPPPAVHAVVEMALSCTQMREERRPNFAEIVRTLRAIHDGSLRSGNSGVAPSHWPPLALLPQAAAPSAPGRMKSPSPSPIHGRRPGSPLLGDMSGHRDYGRHARHSMPVHAASPCPGNEVQAAASLHPGRPVSPMAAEAGRQGGFLHSITPPRTRPQQAILAAAGPVAMPAMPASPCAGAVPGAMGNGVPGGGSATAKPEAAFRAGGVAAVGEEVLFTLECIFSEGTDLRALPPGHRRIVHRSSPSALLPLRVGRAHQASLLDELVTGTSAKSTISREHFQVWAKESPVHEAAGDGRKACTFFVRNMSCHGTHVNGDFLQTRGEQATVHHGDVITLSRSAAGADGGGYQAHFVQFRFDLSSSCLCDGEAGWAGGATHAMEEEEEEDGVASSRTEASQSDTQSEVGNEGDAVFVLEVCGPAARDQLPLEQRRIVYAPPPEDDAKEKSRLYSSLVVGRAYQLDFWQEVLHGDAFKTLSRQHFEVQTWRSGTSTGAPFSFLVRNLSDVNPIHVRGGPEETTEEPPALLARCEQRHLLDGDEIVLNLGQDHTFWLIFRDLTASTHMPASEESVDRPLRVAVDLGDALRLEIDSPDAKAAPKSSCVAPPISTMPAGLGGVTAFAAAGRGQAMRSPPPPAVFLQDDDEISTAATPPDHLFDVDREDAEDRGLALGVARSAGNRAGADWSPLRARGRPPSPCSLVHGCAAPAARKSIGIALDRETAAIVVARGIAVSGHSSLARQPRASTPLASSMRPPAPHVAARPPELWPFQHGAPPLGYPSNFPLGAGHSAGSIQKPRIAWRAPEVASPVRLARPEVQRTML